MAWEATLIDVIKQEMLHLALATNILTAVGAAPHFERPNPPILSRWYPPGVQIAFLPFGERALRHFMYLERPEGMTLEDAEGFAAQPGIQPLASIDRPVAAVPEPWQTVAHLYLGVLAPSRGPRTFGARPAAAAAAARGFGRGGRHSPVPQRLRDRRASGAG